MDNKKKEVLAELEKHKGIVTTACHNTGTPRSTFYNWLKEDSEFKSLVDDIQEVAIDYVESKLFEKIEGVWNDTGKTTDDGEPIIYKTPPSDTAIIFYLKTKAKKRGYIEKSQMEITKGDDVSLDLS
jgi:hypothetical protein